jgi:hypothetical protein
LADMTGAVVQDHAQTGATILPAQAPDKERKATAIQTRQEEEETPATARLDRGIQPQPLIAILDHPRRPNPAGTPPPSMPTLEAKARLIHGKEPFNFVRRQCGPEVLF